LDYRVRQVGLDRVAPPASRDHVAHLVSQVTSVQLALRVSKEVQDRQVLLELQAIQAVWDHQVFVVSTELLVTLELLDQPVCDHMLLPLDQKLPVKGVAVVT